jgi:hypothetical protein
VLARRDVAAAHVAREARHGDCEEDEHDRDAERHPREERHVDAGRAPEEADADQVRRRADRRAQPTDRRAERRRQQQHGAVPMRRLAVRLEHREQRQTDRQHHGHRRSVADPHGNRATDRPVHDEHAERARADARQRQHREREAPVEVMKEDRLRQHERPDEEEDQRIGERRERLAGGRDAERDRQGDADEGGHRHRDGLGDPEDDDRAQHGREPMGGLRQLERGKPQCREGDRREDEAGHGAVLPCPFLLARHPPAR